MTLQIPNARDRALVRLADAVAQPLVWPRAWRRPRRGPVRRVLLMRVERIGDLLMTLDAIALARASWPEARIALSVGSWNADLARLIDGVDDVLVADVPWLAREDPGMRWPSLIGTARGWRAHRFDIAINFEPDIRSNVLAWLSGAPRRFGYWTGGGGPWLTDAAAYDPGRHVADNAQELVARAVRATGGQTPEHSAHARLAPSTEAVARADALLSGAHRPLVGVHASGGRESKQWHADRFAEVARRLADAHGATIVLTGSAADRPLVDRVAHELTGTRVVDACGLLDVPALAALIARLDLLVTGDTGPMHLAAAMDTPIVALFGPSDPRRYGPLAQRAEILRIDLPCSPCGLVRLPPERCRGHVPDCLDLITVDAVVSAATRLLERPAARAAREER